MIRRLFITVFLTLIGSMSVTTIVFAQGSLTPNDPGFTQQWYLEKIKAPEAWERGRQLRGSLGQGSADVIIAVIDSGVDIDHPDLKDNIWTNPREIPGNGIDDDHNGYIDDVHGWDFLTNTNDPRPKVDNDTDLTRSPLGVHHGTIIAGLAAAVGDNSQGVAGVVWHSSILPLRVIHSDGSGEATQVARAIDYAIAQGANIINLSFVGDTNTSVLANAVMRAQKAGILIVAAAGNQTNLDGASHVYDLDATPLYPICHDGLDNAVIGVTSTDKNDQKSSFASFGTHCIDVSAPGEELIVTRATDPRFGPVRLYGFPIEGTSMSTALVSGSAALLKSLFPNVSMKRIGEVLMSSADSVDASNSAYVNRMGRGRINLDRAVEELSLGEPLIPVGALPTETVRSTIATIQTEDVIVVERFTTHSTITIEILNSKGGPLRSIDIPTEWKKLPSVAVLSNGRIVFGAPVGQEPWVRVYSSEGTLIGSKLVYPRTMHGGVSVIPYGDRLSNGVAVLPQQNAGGQLLMLDSDLHSISQQFIVRSTIRANWLLGRFVDEDGDDGIIAMGSESNDDGIIITPAHPAPRVIKLPSSKRSSGWKGLTTLSGYRDASGVVTIVGGFGSSSQIQVGDRLLEAYPRAFNLGVSAGWLIDEHGDPIVATLALHGPGHLREFDQSGQLGSQVMIGSSNLRVDWKASFARIRTP